MNKYKSEPKLTVDQIIEKMIDSTAYQLSTRPNKWRPMEFIPKKNAPTLAKMLKSRTGHFELAPYTDHDIQFSSTGLAFYETEIRNRAYSMIKAELDRELGYMRDFMTIGMKTFRLRFTATNIAKRYWSNSPDFTFIDWQWSDEYSRSNSLNCIYDHESAVRYEERIQIMEAQLVRTIIGKIPRIELCLHVH